MATEEKWYFTKEQLANTPSRKCGIDADKELSCRQQAANLIQYMGQKLMVSQLCINTAIVYMHRFYVFHSLTHFHRNSMASAALFLAAKVEEQPRKLEHVIKVAFICQHKDAQQTLDIKSEQYHELAQDLVFNENVLLQTLGFDVAIDHPHTHVVRCCHLVKASKDLAQTSYFMASNSLHLTTMCLQYKPTIVACFCIHLACKWSNWEIPQSNEGKDWFWYVDKSVTSELLGQLTGEFLHIFDKCPSRLKRKIHSISANQSPNITASPSMTKSPFDTEPRKVSPANADGIPNFGLMRSEIDGKKTSTSQSNRVDYREYREKRERERLEREKAVANVFSTSINSDPNKHHAHHHKQQSSSSSTSAQNKHASSSSSSATKQAVHHNHHHSSSRQDAKSASQMTQRHSTAGNNSSSSSGSRDAMREKQRISREHGSVNNAHPPHNHSLDILLESTQDSQTSHPPEKLNNILHKSHAKQQHQKDTTNKLYSKYSDPSVAKNLRKDPNEQRAEEVRKLIEKPLPPPKPRAELMKEDYAAMMLKQSHHLSKYHQSEKINLGIGASQATLPSLGSESKSLNVGQTAFTTEKSPNAPVSATQVLHKSLSGSSKNSSSGISATSSFSLGNSFEEPKIDKKPNEENLNPINPANKHRSLFSPEKIVTNTSGSAKESHVSRTKQKQKTSPVVPKQENHSSFTSSTNVRQNNSGKQRLSNGMEIVSLQKQHRPESTGGVSTNVGLSETSGSSVNRIPDIIQPIKDNCQSNSNKNLSSTSAQLDLVSQPIELNKFFDNMEPMMFTNQKSKQNPGLSNGLSTNFGKEYSMMDPFNVKPEFPEEFLSNEISSDYMFPTQDQKITNYNLLSFKDTLLKEEPRIKTEPIVKQDSYSPLKSAQSISALLQEPLAPMPSLLQNYDLQQQSQQIEEDVDKEPVLPSTVDMSELATPIQCTIDIPVITTSATTTITPAISTTTSATAAGVASTLTNADDKKSDHNKCEKKKKEKKHKKEKEKSKDKSHKHKHKEKDKEKHRREKSDREKDKTDEGSNNGTSASSTALSAVPIKITIPKDKLNLSTDTINMSALSTQSSGLKIKIPKERLKVSDVSAQQLQSQQLLYQQMQQQSLAGSQAPLKLKIRTDALSRSSSNNNNSSTGELQAAAGQQLQFEGNTVSRKRERSSDGMDNLTIQGAPPSKKPPLQQPSQKPQQQQQQHQQQQQRPNERQNGRHGSYNNMSSTNNKVRGVGRGLGRILPPYPYPPQYGLVQHNNMRGGEPGYRGYLHQRQSPPPFLRHPRPPIPPHHHPYFMTGNFHPPPGVIQQQQQRPSTVFGPGVGYTPNVYDSATYHYQLQQQQQYAPMYPMSAGFVISPNDGNVDMSLPPPSTHILTGQSQIHGQIREKFVQETGEKQSQVPPPLPNGPPPSSSPPPPPPPE